MNSICIKSVRVIDLRFPTSRFKIGSDAVNTDPDYSAAYCILETDSSYEGHGLTFTLGRGTELCALEYLSRYVKGRTLDSITNIRRGHYLLPEAPGYNGEVLPESLEEYAFPCGSAWAVDGEARKETVAT